MPLMKSGSASALHNNIAEMMKAGHPQKQAIAAALAQQRKYKKMAEGGMVEDERDEMGDGLAKEIDDPDEDTTGAVESAIDDAGIGFADGGEVDADADMTPMSPMDMEPEAPASGAKEPIIASTEELPDHIKEAIHMKREASLRKMKMKHRKK